MKKIKRREEKAIAAANKVKHKKLVHFLLGSLVISSHTIYSINLILSERWTLSLALALDMFNYTK